MPKVSYRFIGIVFFVCILITILNRYVFHNAISHGAVRVIAKPATFLFERVGIVRNTVQELQNIKNLSIENAKLRQENTMLIARLGKEDSLARENDFLRRSLRLVQRLSLPTQEAGIFTSQFVGTGFQTLVNKGARDSVALNDIVTSEQGVLIGRVAEVFESYSRVQLLTDPAMEIGSRVLGKNTMGIAQGALEQGLILNLVIQDEDIAEGDTIVSNGHDSFPAGLILGNVSLVEVNESDVFKKIRIEPGIGRIPLGPVLLIKVK